MTNSNPFIIGFIRTSHFLVIISILFTLFSACNTNIDEPDFPDTPQVEPEQPTVDPPKRFEWSDLECKTYNGKDIFMDRCYHEILSHCSGNISSHWTEYSRYSDHQFLKIISATDSTITAMLSAGWFNIQYLPGCSKTGAVAIPRIIPTQNNITINFKLNHQHEMNSKFCDSIGNNICGDVSLKKDHNLIGIDRIFYLNNYREAYRKLTFVSYHITNPDFSFMTQGGTLDRTYYSFHGFGDIAETNNFITANWKSDIFNRLSENQWSISEFFTYITNLNFLSTPEYFSCTSSEPKESMDRIMAMRFDETMFYYNTMCLNITGHYKSYESINSIAYDRLAINFVPSDNENECLFFINPEILINGTTQIKLDIYDDQANEKGLDTSISTDKVTFPMHTPKSYDWNAEMLLALSPYTANGLPMISQINTKDYGNKKRDFLNFAFSDRDISKKFIRAYFSVLEDTDNFNSLKNCIRKDSNLNGDKKRVIFTILDNLSSILLDGTDFETSFQLFGELRDAEYWDQPYVCE